MILSRRAWMAGALGSTFQRGGLPIGVMAGNLRQKNELEGIAAAARLGFDCVQVSIGRPVGDGRLPLAIAENQDKLRAALTASRLRLSATYLDVLHVNCLKNDPLGQRRVSEGIELTRRLGCDTLMLVFFFGCGLDTRAEQDHTAGVLKELLPEAERARVVLGFENAIPVADNIRIHDQLGSPWFKIWYDVGNATSIIQEDAPAAIRRMGRERICQFHLKDKGYLGEGAVPMPAVLDAIHEISYRGPLIIEGSSPTKDGPGDMARNLAWLRRHGA